MSVDPDWCEFTIGHLLDLSNGINAEKSAYGSGSPFINILEVITHESITAHDVPGRVNLPKKTLDRYRVKRGDVLFNRTSETPDEVGLTSVYLGDDPVVFGGFVFRGRPKTVDLEVDYSKYALRAPSVRQQITARGQGGIRANIGQRDLKSVRVSLPGRPEQRAIAHAIDDASALIATLERQIAKKQAIKQGMMQQLLTGRTRLAGFTKEWRVCTLGEVLDVRHGKSQREVEVASGRFPILATGGQIGWARTPLYSKPSVLIGRKGTIDRPQFQDQPFWTVDTLFYTEISVSADPRFLYYVFLTVNWNSMNEASGVPSLSSSRIESVEVRLPDHAEQIAIREVLDDAQAEIEGLLERLQKANATKTGMMQQLLTGRVRLPSRAAS